MLPFPSVLSVSEDCQNFSQAVSFRSTIFGIGIVHTQACWPLKLWAHMKKWYDLSHFKEDMSATLSAPKGWDHFSQQQRSIKSTKYFSQRKSTLMCKNSTHFGVPIFSLKFTLLKSCSQHICPFLFEEMCNRSMISWSNIGLKLQWLSLSINEGELWTKSLEDQWHLKDGRGIQSI